MNMSKLNFNFDCKYSQTFTFEGGEKFAFIFNVKEME